jgi:hypothetical protein
VFHPRHIHRSVVAFGIAVTLAVPATALAQQDLRSPDARDAASTQQPASPQIFTDQQRAAVERYKRSPSYQAALRDARTVVVKAHPSATADDSRWLTIALAIAAMLTVLVLSVMSLRRLRLRRRRAVIAS